MGIERTGDCGGNFVLKDEDIGHRAVVTLAPQRQLRRGFDKVRRDADHLAGAADRPVEHVRCAQFADDLPDGLVGAAKLEAGNLADDPKAAGAGNGLENILADAVGKIGHFGVARKIVERQHGKDRRGRAGRRHPVRSRIMADLVADIGDEGRPGLWCQPAARVERRACLARQERHRLVRFDQRDIADQAVADLGDGLDAAMVAAGRFGQPPQPGDDAVDRIIADDAAFPALAHQFVARNDAAIGHGEHDQHLHDPWLDGFGAAAIDVGNLAQGRFDNQPAKPEGRGMGKIDLIG